jgi:hypothetical protein
MPKVIITAEVENSASWEAGFRTHGDLFRSQGVTSPIHFTTSTANKVIICFELENPDMFMGMLGSAATAEAMAFDGVRVETVNVSVLDRQFNF